MNTTPVFKSGARTSKNTIEQLVFSLFFQRYLKGYLVEFFDNMLYKFQCGFRRGYETRHCLLLVLEIRKGATDNNKVFGSSFEGFSKP